MIPLTLVVVVAALGYVMYRKAWALGIVCVLAGLFLAATPVGTGVTDFFSSTATAVSTLFK